MGRFSFSTTARARIDRNVKDSSRIESDPLWCFGGNRVRASRVQLLRILRDTISERPILFLNLHEIDEHILGTKPQSGVESVGHGPVERFLLLDGSTGVER
jgi:hypothetical protein